MSRKPQRTPYDLVTDPWHYSGDVGLEHGGTFVKMDNVRYGYAECVEVTDLDSACGADGMCLIEKGTINFDYKRVRKAIESCGWIDRGRAKMDKPHRRAMYLQAVKDYYGMDVDGSEVIQTDPTFPMRNDGWKATKVVSHIDLPGYVVATYVD